MPWPAARRGSPGERGCIATYLEFTRNWLTREEGNNSSSPRVQLVGVPMYSLYDFARMLASNRKNSEDAAEVFSRGETLVVVIADGAGGIRGAASLGRAGGRDRWPLPLCRARGHRAARPREPHSGRRRATRRSRSTSVGQARRRRGDHPRQRIGSSSPPQLTCEVCHG